MNKKGQKHLHTTYKRRNITSSAQHKSVAKKTIFLSGLVILFIIVAMIGSHVDKILTGICMPPFPYMDPATALQLEKKEHVRFCIPQQTLALAQSVNTITTENALTGTSAWQITQPSTQSTEDVGETTINTSSPTPTPPPSFIEGYAGKQSYMVGDTASFYVHASDTNFTADVYRLGWYGGQGSRYMGTYTSTITNSTAPIITPDPTTGIVSENWQPSFSLTIPSTWVTGWYLVKLTGASGIQGYIPFILKDGSSASDLIYIHGNDTDQAYNYYGGASFYQNYNNSLPTGHADYVSFNRPYAVNAGAGNSLSWEYPFIRWVESKGYNVTYVSDSDVEANPNILLGHKGIITAGHTEYWSKNMRDALDAALAAGEGYANFSADESEWHIRFADNLRTIISYKDPQIPDGSFMDPLYSTDPTLDTSEWRNPLTTNRPEQTVIGSMYRKAYFSPSNISYPWVATNTSAWPRWLIQNTGIADGMSFPGIVGYEYDRIQSLYPAPSNDIQLSQSPVSNVYANPPGTINDDQQSTIYQTVNNGWVFNAGSIDWSWGLDNWTASFTKYPTRTPVANSAIQQLTANVLNQIIGYVPPIPVSYYKLITTSSPSYSPPLAYYRLDDVNSTAVTSIGSLNGTYKGTGSPKFSQQGALTQSGDLDPSVQFDGVSQYVNIGNNATLNGNKFSLEAWVYPLKTTNRYMGIASSRAFPQGWVIYINNNDTSHPYYTSWVNNGTAMLATANTGSGVAVQYNSWTYIVMTFDGATVRLYVNGKYVASGTVSSFKSNTKNPETIAQGEPGSGFFFAGKVDEVAFYNYPLTCSTIDAHYQAAGHMLSGSNCQ